MGNRQKNVKAAAEFERDLERAGLSHLQRRPLAKVLGLNPSTAGNVRCGWNDYPPMMRALMAEKIKAHQSEIEKDWHKPEPMPKTNAEQAQMAFAKPKDRAVVRRIDDEYVVIRIIGRFPHERDARQFADFLNKGSGG